MCADLIRIPTRTVVGLPTEGTPAREIEIGTSLEGRSILAYRYGSGRAKVSLIGGCHADEPVGPDMLRRLCRHLETLGPEDHLLSELTWVIVPHANPDGELRNEHWSRVTIPCLDSVGKPDLGYELASYVEAVDRELPGLDMEFGFPRDKHDTGARPENRAVARFLEEAGPFVLHGSFHGMDFAPGPWFLTEPGWTDRTQELRDRVREAVRGLGYSLFDVDRGGEKGFFRIDEGFTTRPDSAAMVRHFLDRDDPKTASRFRPSSMEFVRGLGGDPFTLVSEMPLFLLSQDHQLPHEPVGTEGRLRFLEWLKGLIRERGGEKAREEAFRLGLTPMPIRDQMRLQIEFLNQAIAAARAWTSNRTDAPKEMFHARKTTV